MKQQFSTAVGKAEFSTKPTGFSTYITEKPAFPSDFSCFFKFFQQFFRSFQQAVEKSCGKPKKLIFCKLLRFFVKSDEFRLFSKKGLTEPFKNEL